jgi:hypothetical protein
MPAGRRSTTWQRPASRLRHPICQDLLRKTPHILNKRYVTHALSKGEGLASGAHALTRISQCRPCCPRHGPRAGRSERSHQRRLLRSQWLSRAARMPWPHPATPVAPPPAGRLAQGRSSLAHRRSLRSMGILEGTSGGQGARSLVPKSPPAALPQSLQAAFVFPLLLGWHATAPAGCGRERPTLSPPQLMLRPLGPRPHPGTCSWRTPPALPRRCCWHLP